jgi:ketosteroid isomerase-like protein
MKRNPYRAAYAALLLALVVACSPGGDPAVDVNVEVNAGNGPAATLESAMQADRDFAAMVASEGPAAAFEAWFDAEGEFVEPGIVTKGGAQVAENFAQSPPGFTIEWAPDGGHGSASGDLAVTTGRYTVKADMGVLAVGRYLTTWRKSPDGQWKVVLDTTVADPAPATVEPEQQGSPS